MDLSVVIVNYNVRYFLEQALYSVVRASAGLQVEVFVVDNNSVDGSQRMVKEKFPEVTLIANTANTGFSRANNQAIRLAQGRYILLLNPDTVVQEDTFRKVVSFMDEHPDAGALGVRMIDGKGQFLPESKRGLPTPEVAMYKMLGLSTLFPRTRWFGKYHLGYLPENETHPVDVLSGAFMLLRKTALDKTGLLDETFFMYGEDIDLSYRIQLAGYRNYYFPETTIIHYKGESTKKQSTNYVRVFYQAMVIFARKHYGSGRARLFSWFIEGGIWARAALSLVFRFFRAISLPALDFLLSLLCSYGIIRYWELNHKYVRNFYPEEYFRWHVPAYILIVLLCIAVSGRSYRQPWDPGKIIRGTLLGILLLLAGYGMLPKEMQFSRAILLFAGAFTGLVVLFNRLWIHLVKYRNFDLGRKSPEKVVIAGSAEECERVHSLMERSGVPFSMEGFVSTGTETPQGGNWIGNWNQLSEVIRIFSISEVIFCSGNLSAEQIISCMSENAGSGVKFKIVPENSLYIIGSNSKNEPGEWYSVDIRLKLGTPEGRKQKRMFDVLVALSVLLLFPLAMLFPGWRKILFASFSLLRGHLTCISYRDLPETADLPELKPGLFSPMGMHTGQPSQMLRRMAYVYARDYSWKTDLETLLKSCFKLRI